MEVEELAEIVETMALQHSYPGFDVRSLQLGLPEAAVNSPVKLFGQALKHDSVVVKLAALRWFWQRPGVAKRYVQAIAALFSDQDEWVRREAVRALGRVAGVEDKYAIEASRLLADSDAEVRKAAAQAIGKLGCTNEEVLASLRKAAEDADVEVRWKAEKALRKLGEYA